MIRHTILIFSALALFACQNRTKQPSGNKDLTVELMRSDSLETAYTAESIDNELHMLLSDLHRSEWDYEEKQSLFVERLTLHLSDSFTFHNDLPRTDSIMNMETHKYRVTQFLEGYKK